MVMQWLNANPGFFGMIRTKLDPSSLTIPKPDWESYCHKVADLIMSEQSPAKVLEVRGKFYELLSHCIPPTVILKVRHSPRPGIRNCWPSLLEYPTLPFSRRRWPID